MQDKDYRKFNNNAAAGLLLLIVGSVWLYRQIGFYTPDWLFTWPMLLVTIGIFVGLRSNFRDLSWLFLTGIGVFFLADDWWPEVSIQHYIWPVIIIGVGLGLLLSPRHRGAYRYKKNHKHDYYTGEKKSETAEEKINNDREEVLDIVSVFAGVKKTVYSKKFIGGDAVCIFGGADINLSQADFEGTIVLDFVHIFGGSKLIIPPHWEIRSEAAVIFGGIEDKRKNQQQHIDHSKVVILKGAIIFGGIELRSY